MATFEIDDGEAPRQTSAQQQEADSRSAANIEENHGPHGDKEPSEILLEGVSLEGGEDEEQSRIRRRNRCIRWSIGVFLLAFILFVVSDSLKNQYIKDGINDFLDWVEDHPVGGFFAFTAVVFCTTLLFIPGILLSIGSGFVFANAFGVGVGVLLGTISIFVGAGAGAIVSFLLGRFLLQDCVSGLTKKMKILEALDKAMEEKGFRIMFLLRLSPVIFASPYVSYGVGGMSISFKDYSLSLVALLPGSIMYAFLGASADSLTGDDDNKDDDDNSGGNPATNSTTVMIVGIVLSVIAVGLTSYYVRKELLKISRSTAQDTDEASHGVLLQSIDGSGSATDAENENDNDTSNDGADQNVV